MSQNNGPDIQKFLQIIEEAVGQATKDNARIISFLKECRQFGIEVLPLDLNKSQATCAIEAEQQIRIGFSMLVSESEQIVEEILAERQQYGPFRSLQDFCERIDLDRMPEHFITRCIEAGAFDSTGASRARLFQGQESVLQTIRNAKAAEAAGQINLFAMLPAASKQPLTLVELPDVEEWTEEEIITHEKHAAGFSFTEYGLQSADELVSESNLAESDQPMQPVEPPAEEDEASLPNELAQPSPVEPSEPEVEPSAEAISEGTTPPSTTFIIQLQTTSTEEYTLFRLQDILAKHPGNVNVVLEFIDENNQSTHVRAARAYAVQVSDQLVQDVEAFLGAHTTRVQDEKKM